MMPWYNILPFCQAVEPPAPMVPENAVPKHFEYSIRSAFVWHENLAKRIIDWCIENYWLLLVGVAGIIATYILCYFFYYFIKKVVVFQLDKKHPKAALELQAVCKPIARLLFWFGTSSSVDIIPFSERIHHLLDNFFYLCFMLTLLNLFKHCAECTSSLLMQRFKNKDPQNYTMNKLMVDLSASIIRLLLWVFVIMFILQEIFNFNITSLVASAGILGVGIALAAKDTVANIFGAFTILVGKMFKVGDWIKIDSTQGIVDQICFRCIRIRAFDDARLIEIPNHRIADTQIENFNKRQFWREHFCFGLVYQTTPEQMALAKKLLNEIVDDLSDLIYQEKKSQFDFLLFDQSSLNLDGFVWFKPTDWLTMRHNRGVFNEEVLKRFNAAGLEFAYPTTTVLMEHNASK